MHIKSTAAPQPNLVIVESPAKAKTIGKFLGDDFKVMSSYGHIRDLNNKSFGIDLETMSPQYEIPQEKLGVVADLKKAAKKAETVWLASDEDREGEAISWHLAEVLGLDPENTHRIVFHEITKNAILAAIENPRTINRNLVYAQQARRVLDRIVGFKLSPVLWRKVKPGLSAGRVQSVALRLIADREREIQKFEAKANYQIVAELTLASADGTPVTVKADMMRRVETKEEAVEILERLKGATFTVESMSKKTVKRAPQPPLMTSTLQQEAARRLGMSVSQTMRIAQSLYEEGHISYMRTDSLNLSSFCVEASKNFITEAFGEKYLKVRQFHNRAKGAQEAHEAIRPTFMDVERIRKPAPEQRLYQLIRFRTLASLMADAIFERTTVVISASGLDEKFELVGEVPVFDGFLRVYKDIDENGNETTTQKALPPMKKGQVLACASIIADQRFSARPTRYNEATLVHKMEELGIGRPSTYAPTISTIQQRGYVEKRNGTGFKRTAITLVLKDDEIMETTHEDNVGAERNRLFPTDIGSVVNDFLSTAFQDIMDYHFTFKVEKDFDSVANGKKSWDSVIKAFYKTFGPEVDAAIKTQNELKVGERQLGVDPETGKGVFVKIGPFGPIAQLGAVNDAEKPTFAPLLRTQRLDTITLEEALELFKLPRIVGEHEGEVVKVNNGRYGPYAQIGHDFVSIPKPKDPMTITLEEVLDLYTAKRNAIAISHLRSFEEDPDMELRTGRYGPYLTYKGQNYRMSKKDITRLGKLTYEDCLAIIKNPPTTKKRKKQTKK